MDMLPESLHLGVADGVGELGEAPRFPVEDPDIRGPVPPLAFPRSTARSTERSLVEDQVAAVGADGGVSGLVHLHGDGKVPIR